MATSTENPDQWVVIPGIDIPTARERMGGDWGAFLKRVGGFLKEFADFGMTGAASIQGGDFKPLRARLHKLAGSAGMLGATDLMNAAKHATDVIHNQPPESVPAALLVIQQRLAELNAAIEPLQQRHAIAAALHRAAETDSEIEVVDAQTLQDFEGALRAQRFAAIETYRSLQPALTRMLDSDAAAQLDAAFEALEFTQAAELVAALRGQP